MFEDGLESTHLPIGAVTFLFTDIEGSTPLWDREPENLAYLDHPVAFDWQEATCSLMTIDLTWFVNERYVLSAMGLEQAICYYREHLENNLNKRFEEDEWQIMVDLGFLVNVLHSTCFPSYWYKHTEEPKE